MADRLYLSLWFPSFSESEMLARVEPVLRQFPYSAGLPGIRNLAVFPISWNEAAVFEEGYLEGAEPAYAVERAAQFLHDDYAYDFEAFWDLWHPKPDEYDVWEARPEKVRLVALGTGFEDSLYQREGHMRINFGLDSPFLYEDLDLTPIGEANVKANVQKLVDFTTALEKKAGVGARLLWSDSESDETLAQKLVARLQKVQ